MLQFYALIKCPKMVFIICNYCVMHVCDSLSVCECVCVCVYVKFIGTYKVENELMIPIKCFSPPLSLSLSLSLPCLNY